MSIAALLNGILRCRWTGLKNKGSEMSFLKLFFGEVAVTYIAVGMYFAL